MFKNSKKEKQQLAEQEIERRNKFIHTFLNDDEFENLLKEGLNEKEIEDLLHKGFSKEELMNYANFKKETAKSNNIIDIVVEVITWIIAFFTP